MTRITDDIPTINANFAATALNRAAELIADGAAHAELDVVVIGAFPVPKHLKPIDHHESGFFFHMPVQV